MREDHPTATSIAIRVVAIAGASRSSASHTASVVCKKHGDTNMCRRNDKVTMTQSCRRWPVLAATIIPMSPKSTSASCAGGGSAELGAIERRVRTALEQGASLPQTTAVLGPPWG